MEQQTDIWSPRNGGDDFSIPCRCIPPSPKVSSASSDRKRRSPFRSTRDWKRVRKPSPYGWSGRQLAFAHTASRKASDGVRRCPQLGDFAKLASTPCPRSV